MYSQTFACDQNQWQDLTNQPMLTTPSFEYWLVEYVKWQQVQKARTATSEFTVQILPLSWRHTNTLCSKEDPLSQILLAIPWFRHSFASQLLIVPMALMFPLYRIFVALQVTSNVARLPPFFCSPQLVDNGCNIKAPKSPLICLPMVLDLTNVSVNI